MTWDIHQLFRRHAAGIMRSLRRRGLSEDVAADLTQDTFLRVLASPPRRDAENHNPKAYLYQVSRSLSINHQRRVQLLAIADLAEEAFAEIADPAPTPEKIVYDRQCLARTEAALAELPERTRRAFEMHRLEERTIASVAEELGLSVTRTWGLIREAYRHLVMRVDAAD
ncbi:DNA-directed RNA polymerase sigma-70 factor [Azorhizobium oxalatiphilum]|uniref:DNA-directed RNA polymerase sigma-70 factor n=1 Tax=Azorhizobium oxalatiphilum TaxID=980631 RepID=A0A917F7G1_9HYPH|nr:sigma-70 family RNA polymerase sigma factor [Azorhizobium oxalatiphilum]GGF51233.1 DNA-directed RNA polymerase sigma-70 factor [Azorhizobium oxalatiphilum]